MNYYLAGPFFNEECSKYFNEVIERCKETSMDNYETDRNEVEDSVLSKDTVFVPGHFKVDFNKIRSEYDPVSFRRVLRQVLDLDLENITDGLIVYPKGYDLGTMFELGYFLSRNSGGGKYQAYNEIRKRLIIKDPDEELIRCIDKLISSDFWNGITSNYRSDNECGMDLDSIKLAVSDGASLSSGSGCYNGFLGVNYPFNLVALNVDNYKDSPFNSMLAGFLYSIGIPFITYSCNDMDSNVMMLASSLCHIKLDSPSTNLEDEIKSNFLKSFWDNSYFNKFKDIK